MKRIFGYWLAMLVLSCVSAIGHAQSSFSKAQLDQMLAPVALYPDALLAQLLMASTYPEDVAAAAKWSSEHQSLKGDAAVTAAQDQGWDPSVTSLTAFPSVLDMMGREPDWVKSLGDAFLDQPDEVMASVQRLRAEAQKAGNLASNEQQTVTTKTEGGNTYVTVEPASPSVVYVPSYNPATTYGAWPYPAYPPAYYPPPPGSVFATALVSGLAFGAGIAIVNSLWGGCNWGSNDVDINVNKYNNINTNRQIDASRRTANWQHDPARRGDVPYRGSGTQQRFNEQRTAALQSQGRGTGQGPGQGAGRGIGQGAGQGIGQGAGQGLGQRAGQAPGQGPGQGGAGRPGAQPGPAGDQQAKRERAQQVMRERGGDAGSTGRTGAPRAGGDRGAGAGAGAAGDRRTGTGAGAGAGANRSSSSSAAINRDQTPSAATNRGQSREAATSRNQSRDAAYARSRDQNRDNGLRDVNSSPRQFQQASRPASNVQNRPQQNRATPRDTGGGRQMNRGSGGGGGGGRGGRR